MNGWLHGWVCRRCRECGGASICEHGGLHCTCKECGGASICDHGRLHHTCRELVGASFCDHGRTRHTCKESGGASICQHGRVHRCCNSSVVHRCASMAGCADIARAWRCIDLQAWVAVPLIERLVDASIGQHSRWHECIGASICQHDRVDPWMDGSMDGWTDPWMDGAMDGCRHGLINPFIPPAHDAKSRVSSICQHGRLQQKGTHTNRKNLPGELPQNCGCTPTLSWRAGCGGYPYAKKHWMAAGERRSEEGVQKMSREDHAASRGPDGIASRGGEERP